MATKSIYKLDNERITSDSIVHKKNNGEYKNLKTILNGMENQNILWEGAYYMHSNQEVKLLQKLSEQQHGIVLIFSGYTPNVGARNWNHTCYFIPKEYIKFWNGGAVCIPMGGDSGITGWKYIYIQDDHLNGNAHNTDGDNTSYVLSQVIGV